ncbi:hypothetical protein T484DRAFT_1772601 [Baffinella frigidus]|nr:hypothetical protein T484DRAFT_1772601 [Cryptophyta sp. CCMP2293]
MEGLESRALRERLEASSEQIQQLKRGQNQYRDLLKQLSTIGDSCTATLLSIDSLPTFHGAHLH